VKVAVLSKSDTSSLLDTMRSSWPQGSVPRVKNFKSYEIDAQKSLLVSDEVVCAKVSEDKIIPFLGEAELLQKFPTVTVDMGAVKFVCNGANVMRPGVTRFDEFKKGSIVTVRDQQHGKVLAVGLALDDSQAAASMTKGYVVENLHYISDKIWEAAKEVKVTRS
jgi:PUA domain protein